jgi:predicted metal-dependent hydrolase
MIDNEEPEEHGHAHGANSNEHTHIDDRIDFDTAKEEYIKNQEKSFDSLTNFYAKQHKSHVQEIKDKIENILKQRDQIPE